MGPESSAEKFNIGGTIQSTSTSLYLNVHTEDAASYKTLTFDATPGTNAWALEGDTIITDKASSFGRRESSDLSSDATDLAGLLTKTTSCAELNFLVCQLSGSYWQVYLQTGSATPSGKQCSNYQSLHLPCIC